jgi:tripartite-type tricarboxylate transporter receptor subunit TctC
VIKDLPYDADKDFVPVINLVRSNSVLFAKADAPFNSIKEMVAYAKVKPGVLNWATWGTASIPEVYLLWIRHQAGVNITGVAYKGSGPSTAALVAGEVDVTFMSIGGVLPHIKSGKAKPLAVVGNQRSAHLADTPSLAETGLDPGLRSYFGVFAPAGTPKAIVDRLNAEFAKALQTPRMKEFTHAQTLDPVGGSAAEFARFLKEDRANAGRVFKAIGVRPGNAKK